MRGTSEERVERSEEQRGTSPLANLYAQPRNSSSLSRFIRSFACLSLPVCPVNEGRLNARSERETSEEGERESMREGEERIVSSLGV